MVKINIYLANTDIHMCVGAILCQEVYPFLNVPRLEENWNNEWRMLPPSGPTTISPTASTLDKDRTFITGAASAAAKNENSD